MTKALEAKEQPVAKIFSDDYVFSIPDYQRPYSWTTEQAQDLLEDLRGYIKANPGEVSDKPSYFLGSIVLIKSTSPEADVVDGQQRLTTLTLLLAAIRANVDAGLRGEITKYLYEKGNTFTGTKDRFRLTLRKRDAEFFQRYVQREAGFEQLLLLAAIESDSQKNLRDNAAYFQKELQKISESARIELGQFILQRCYLVTVSTPDQASAYRIFSVLNSRGLDLAATDILKAKIIGGIPEQQRVAYTEKWENAEEDLGREDFNALFGHVRTVYSKTKAKESLLKEFDQYVPKHNEPVQFIDDVLLPMANAFADISASSYAAPTHADQVNEHLRWLNRLEFNDWVPPTLVFFANHRHDASKLTSFLSDLERLAYFMLVTSASVYERIDRFAKVTREIESASDLHVEASALQLSPIEQFEFYSMLDGPLYDALSTKARTPVVLRLDSIVSDGTASYQHDVVTIEHVLPQNPKTGSDWERWFPDPTTRTSWVHRVGNLALLSRKKNSQALNWDFDRKKSSYFRRSNVTPFALTTQVIDHDEWTIEIVEARQRDLMSRFEAHWRLGNRASVL